MNSITRSQMKVIITLSVIIIFLVIGMINNLRP